MHVAGNVVIDNYIKKSEFHLSRLKAGALLMQFSVGRPDMIRAINQRWLLKFWKRSLGSRDLPPWQAVESEDLSRVSANLSFLDVVDDDGEARFKISFHGATIGQVYGSTDCRGKYLDELVTGGCTKAQIPYRQVVAEGCPVYTVFDLKDRAGRIVHFERLLLPFANNGDIVDRILASFEFVCVDGAFDSRDLMKMHPGPPTLRLSATIERHLPA